MYVWPEDEPEMIPVISLVRLGRGLMMGVDHNRHQEMDRRVGGVVSGGMRAELLEGEPR